MKFRNGEMWTQRFYQFEDMNKETQTQNFERLFRTILEKEISSSLIF